MVCIWGMGDCGTKATAVNETIANTVNKTAVDILNKNQNKASQTGISTQQMAVSKVKAVGCTLNIMQTSKITLKSMQTITSETTSELISDITAALRKEAEQNLKATSSVGSGKTTVEGVNKTITSIENDLKAKLTTENINEMIQYTNQKQVNSTTGIDFDPCGFITWTEVIKKDKSLADSAFGKIMSESMAKCISKSPQPDCNIGQLTSAELVAQQITSSVMAVIAKNKQVQELDEQLKTTATAEGKGFGDMIADIFKGIGSMFSGIFSGLFSGMAAYAGMVSLVCCGCCCCLILLMVGASFMSGAGKGGAPAAAVAPPPMMDAAFVNQAQI